jgi:Dolichyl-phosphate-mannose-protein mannosyltransferase
MFKGFIQKVSPFFKRKNKSDSSVVGVMEKHPYTKFEILGVGILFVVFLFLILQGMGERYLNGHQGFNGAIRSTIARNYVKYGFWGTKFKPIKNLGPTKTPSKGIVHWHHPPLIHMMVAVSFHLFGESEASTRTVPLFFTILSFFLIFLLVRRRYGPMAAFVSILVFSTTPMVIEYGKMANYEPPVVAFILLALWFLDRIRYDNGGKLSKISFVICLLCAGFTDWPGFILAGMVGVEAIVRKPRKLLLIISGGAVSALLLLFLWKWLSSSATQDGLKGLAKYRIGLGAVKVTYSMLFDRTVARLWLYFGYMSVLTAFIWFCYEIVKNRSIDSVIWVFLSSTLIYFTVFKAGAFIHSFFLFYISPVIAVGAGAGVKTGFNFLNKISQKKLQGRSPLIFMTAVAMISGGLYVWEIAPLLQKTKYLSYGVRSPYEKSRMALPRLGRLDMVLLASMINKMSNENDTILIHRTTHSSPQLRYYMGRNVKRISSLRNLSGGALLLVPLRVISKSMQKRLASKYAVINSMEYLLYNLKREGPRARFLEFKTYPGNMWWTFYHSLFYPPHRLVNNRHKAVHYLKSLGLRAGKKPK